MYHILSCEQFSRAELEELFNLTDEIRNNLPAYRTALAGKLVATIFYEPSTRTRLSFEAAVQRLGGCIVSTENAKEMSSVIKGESLPDTIRVIAGYCDAIILRHPDVNSAREAAAVSGGAYYQRRSGSAGSIPTQALLDVYTIHKHKGAIDGLTVGIMGTFSLAGRSIHWLSFWRYMRILLFTV